MSAMEDQDEVPWGTQWDLVRAAEPAVDGWSGAQVTLGFQDGRAGGRAPINRYFGMCRKDAEGLQFGPFGMTMMAGSPEAMLAETAFLRVLEQVTDLRVTPTELVLLGANGAELLAFVPSADPA